mgnify:CR=1 FL=1
MTQITTPKPLVTSSKRAAEYGSMSLPTVTAVTAKPTIIITHTVVAAGARISCGTRLAIKASNDVPHALTPKPMKAKANKHITTPCVKSCAIQVVPQAAKLPPIAKISTPASIQGVHRRP